MLGRTKEKKKNSERRRGMEERRGLRRDGIWEDPKRKQKSKLKIQTAFRSCQSHAKRKHHIFIYVFWIPGEPLSCRILKRHLGRIYTYVWTNLCCMTLPRGKGRHLRQWQIVQKGFHPLSTWWSRNLLGLLRGAWETHDSTPLIHHTTANHLFSSCTVAIRMSESEGTLWRSYKGLKRVLWNSWVLWQSLSHRKVMLADPIAH